MCGGRVECCLRLYNNVHLRKSMCWGYEISSNTHPETQLLHTRNNHFKHCHWHTIWDSQVQTANRQSIDDAFTKCRIFPYCTYFTYCTQRKIGTKLVIFLTKGKNIAKNQCQIAKKKHSLKLKWHNFRKNRRRNSFWVVMDRGVVVIMTGVEWRNLNMVNKVWCFNFYRKVKRRYRCTTVYPWALP